MQSAKRVTLIPPKNDASQVGSGFNNESLGSITQEVEPKFDKIKSKIYDKIHRFIKIILKLAKNVGYDSEFRIKLNTGKYLERSNVVDLLTHAMSMGKVLYGENEFIELLAKSDVEPDLIINENVKAKLKEYLNKNSRIRNSNGNEEPIKEQMEVIETNIKRKRDDIDDDFRGDDSVVYNKPSKKRKFSEEDINDSDIDNDRWEIPNGD